MKKNIFYTLAAVVTFLTFSCSKDTEVQTPDKPVPVDPIVPTEKSVVLSGDVDATKVSSDNNGAYKWQASDIITILTDNGNNREFTAEEAGISTDFSGHIPDADELEGGFALYPASENHSISGTTITFNMPNELAWGADASYMPMYAPITIVEQKPSASFKAVGGALKLILYNIPSGAAYLAFTAASVNIAGDFSLDTTAETPVISGGESKEIDINFSDNYSANKVFYIPLPPVTLTGGFTISIFDDEANELFSVTSTKGITIGRNKLVIAPALNCASSQTLWSEDFTGYAADAQPSSKGSVNYAYGEAGTKVYTTQLASGGVEGPELLIKSGNGTFTVSNIPTGGATSMTLTFKTNRNLTLSTTTDGISGLDNISSDGNARTVSISNTKEASIFDIEFRNTLSNNARIDDIVVSTVPTSFTAPTISAGAEELTIGVGQSSATTTISLANAIDGLGISALVSGTDADNFTAAIDGTTLTVTAEAANTTAADKVVTVTLKASGASSKAISVTQTSCLVPNPTDLTAIAGDAEVDVTWTGDAHATSYVAYLHTAATATPATGGTNITSSISNSGTNYKIEDYSSVDNDQTYYLYIKVNGVASGYVAPTDFAVVSFTPAQAKGTAENPYLASEAYDIVSAYASGEGPAGTIYVKGYVSSASNPSSNSQTYFISDDGSTTEKKFEVYKGKGISGADIDDANKVSVGDWVVVSGTAINYSGTTPEFSANSTIYTHNPKLAAPEFTPAAGTYYSAQSVAISATNSATIYYTTDGTDPDENSDEYEEPIAVSADMTIKAIAVKADFVTSAVASAAYDIEAPTKLGTPVISVDSYNHNSIAFSWAAVDNATGYQVSTDGGSSWLTKQEETSYNWTGLSASTSYTIKVKAIGTENGQYTDSDVASKSQTTSAPVTLVSIELTTDPTKTTYNVGETFSFAGAVVTATYSDDSNADVTADCTTDYDDVTFSSTGVKTVTVSYTEGSTQTTTFNVTVAIVDVLTGAAAGLSGTSYQSFSISAQNTQSGAAYSGWTAYNNSSYIQFNSGTRGTPATQVGIVSTTSGGYAKKITAVWGGSNTNGRFLTVYGKNTAYSSSSDLANGSSAKGSSLGTITFKTNDTSASLDITGDYEFIGIVASGAMYMSEIDIEWAEGDPTIAMAKTSISDVAAAGVNNASESGVYTFKGGATDADVTVTCDGEIVTSASKNNGSLTYTVAANTGTAREGWIKVQYASESAHTVTVSQNAATYTLTLSSGGNGTVAATVDAAAVASGSAVAVGKTVTITTTPSSGYQLASLSYNDGSAHDITSTKSFTMPSAAVTVSATFSAVPTIGINKSSITNVAAAGVTNASESGVYSFYNGATDADVTVTCDGTIVTAASKNNGALTYTVASNSGAARDGWIKVQYGTEDPHTITVSQLAGTAGYTLTLSSGNLGSITATVDAAAVSSGSSVDSGKTVTITTTPNTGCALISLKYNDGSDHDITSTKTFTMPSANVTVTAVFANVYSLTPNQASTGSSSTTYITTLTAFTYNQVSWKMNQWNPKTLQIKGNQNSAASEFRFYNTSAFSGRIAKVVVTFSALTVSNENGLMFKGGTSEVNTTANGTAGTWNSTNKTLTWTPGASDNFTFFAFYQNGKVISGTNYLASSDAIVVYYE